MSKVIRIGLDFDGVVVYDPVRVARALVKWFKRRVLRKAKLSFFVPKNKWQELVWRVAFGASIFPANGVDKLKKMAGDPQYEFYLITGRFGFLDKHIFDWLKNNHLERTFKKVYINDNTGQPHLFKERIIDELKLDYFVEDNLDVVLYLANKVKTRILWVYNIFDRSKNYQHKFPYLGKALDEIALLD